MKTKMMAAVMMAVAALAASAKESKLVFSGYEGKETLKDFPALVKLPGGLAGFDYKDAAPDGSDVAFFGADGKRLACEIDSWNPDGDSYIWVRVPELTKTTSIVAKWGDGGVRSAECRVMFGLTTILACGTSRNSRTA